jgi:hypothetical protein
MNELKPVTVQDVIDYHRDKDNCHICLQAQWSCPQHQFHHNHKTNQPRYTTAVDDGFRLAIPWKPPFSSKP